MKKVSILLLGLIGASLFSQSTVLHNLNHNRLMSQVVNKIGVEEMVDGEYEGSPFLEKQFLPSTIKGENGTYLLRYNIYNDELILKNEDKYFKIPKEGLDYFNIDNKYIIRLINNTYYLQSSKEKGHYVIVRKENVKFTQAKASNNAYEPNRAAKFSNNKPDYFLYNINEKSLIPFNKEELKKLFPGKTAELDQIFKKSKFKSADDFDVLLGIISN
ncbi:hypothetical protein [Chryseobacterium gallinarum]|uniref:Uncharacterized protein n=1 Tax=Chryseobacterium gallinarum TaxID=1324352 RepID=A0ABX6KSD4_CHRGL|nr:hypothetical protein [Chryseobacterium gallinarum]QIY91392.1 hypothetical protein FOB44_12410 [Chryseobacterium gallinarum]